MNREKQGSRSAWIGAAAVALAGLLVWCFAGGWLASGPARVGPIDSRPQADEPRASSPFSDAPAADRSAALPVGVASSTPPSGQATISLAVVREGTRAPVPNAEVWFWPRSEATASTGEFEEWLRSGEVEQHLATAIAARAGRDGRALLSGVEHGFVAAAAADGLWGWAKFSAPREGPCSVALARDFDLRVQVLDPDGTPRAGVAVALRQRRGPECFEHLAVRTQGSEGIAVLRHASHCLQARAGFDLGFSVGVRGLFDPPIEHPVEAGAPAQELVTLQLRPSGSCDVLVVDADGAALGGAFEARLGFADAQRDAAMRSEETQRSRAGGPVHFEQVELGHALAVEVRREDSGAPLEARGPGPASAGQRVELRLRVETELALLRGRVVDAAGAPVRERELFARIEAGGAPGRVLEGWSLVTAADGSFALETAPRAELPEGAQLALAALSAEGAELAVARRPLPAELRPGSIALGDFVLRDLPVALSGSVVDEEGRPIAGALVSATPGAQLAATHSDAAGQFEIRGQAAGESCWLRAEASSLAGEPVSVRVPATNVRLVLSAAATIEGRVLLEPALLATMVLVQAAREAPASAAALPEGVVSAVLGADGRFTLAGLSAGSYAVHVVYASNACELAVVEGLALRAGQTLRDARLDPLDLRGQHRLIELELVDEGGQPVPHGRAYSRPSAAPDARWTFGRQVGSKVQLLSDGRPLDVAIAAEGYLRAELEGVSASQRVTLRHAAKLRFELARGLRLPEPPLQLGVELSPLEPGRSCGFVDSSQAFFGADGVLTCASAFAGALRVELVVTRRGPGPATLVHVSEAAPRVLQVAPHSGLQVFTLDVDPAALAAAIEAARTGD